MTREQYIDRLAAEMASRCGCRNVRYHRPVARLVVELEVEKRRGIHGADQGAADR